VSATRQSVLNLNLCRWTKKSAIPAAIISNGHTTGMDCTLSADGNSAYTRNTPPAPQKTNTGTPKKSDQKLMFSLPLLSVMLLRFIHVIKNYKINFQQKSRNQQSIVN
jgi:hypothetical protein